MVTIFVILEYTKYMKDLLVKNNMNNMSALKLALTQIKDCKCKKISSIVNVDKF